MIGGGFAGLWAVRALAAEAVDIVLIDRCNHHLFQPLLYQVATAGLSAPAIAAPLRHILRRQRNVTVLLGEVREIDRAARVVHLADGSCERYDQLLVATGATHAYFGHDDWAAHAPGLKTLDDAMLIRARLLGAFERAEQCTDEAAQAPWLNFVIVGAGPTGVELAGTLAEIARHTLQSEFRRIDPTRARVLLIEAGPRVLPAFEPYLSERARQQLERLGVEVLLNSPVQRIDAEGVDLKARRIDARTVVWAAGVAASPLGTHLGVALDRAGRVPVNADLSVPGAPDIYVAGDLAALMQDGKPVPGTAPAAKQMGRHVAENLRRRWRGEPTREFRFRDVGALATIGRMAAVLRMGPLRLTGLPAWWLWLAAHVYFLIGFRNRLSVLLDWAWAYWTYARSARIIFGSGQDRSS